MPYEVKNYAAEGFGNGVVSADRRLQAQLEDYGKVRNDFFTLMGNRMNALANAKDANGYNAATQNAINQIGDEAAGSFVPQLNYDEQGNFYFRRNPHNKVQQKPIIQEPVGGIYQQDSPVNRTAYSPNQNIPTNFSPTANNAQNGTIPANQQYTDNYRKTLNDVWSLTAGANSEAQRIRQQQANGQPISKETIDNYNKLVSALGAAHQQIANYQQRGNQMPTDYPNERG